MSSCQGNKHSEPYLNSPEEIANEDGISSEPEPEPSKEIEWSDGNIYPYDYTEEMVIKDTLGNDRVITVYRRYKPTESDIECEPKTCKWCSKEVYSSNIKIEEFPNSLFNGGMASFFGEMLLSLTGTTYIDLDNNRVRCEWKVECDYPGPDGFCSEKCKSEYEYRE